MATSGKLAEASVSDHGRPRARCGRYADTLYSEDGALLATGRATWIRDEMRFHRMARTPGATSLAVGAAWALVACGTSPPPVPTAPDTGAPLLDIAPIASPPTYLGTVNDSGGCAQSYATLGYAPVSGGPYPLFLYFVGTNFTGQAGDYAEEAPTDVVKAMAQRGFVALSAQYDDGPVAWLSDHQNLLQCMFADPAGLLAAACASPSVDCSLGVATWGHSLGGAVAVLAASSDRRVRAAWATGITGITGVALPPDRLRVVNGSGDSIPGASNSDPTRLDAQTGVTPGDCPGQDNQCLRADGSGWILVQPSELDPVRTADHCWFDNLSCTASGERVEPNFATGTSRISIASNADWLARAAATPW
jgi:hypothetical protein